MRCPKLIAPRLLVPPLSSTALVGWRGMGFKGPNIRPVLSHVTKRPVWVNHKVPHIQIILWPKLWHFLHRWGEAVLLQLFGNQFFTSNPLPSDTFVKYEVKCLAVMVISKCYKSFSTLTLNFCTYFVWTGKKPFVDWHWSERELLSGELLSIAWSHTS